MKQEPNVCVGKHEAEKEVEGQGGEEENGLGRDIMPVEVVVQAVVDAAHMTDVEEVAVIQMEMPNFQIDQATSLQDVGDLKEVDKEKKPLCVLDSAKIAQRKIEHKKKFLERLKQK